MDPVIVIAGIGVAGVAIGLAVTAGRRRRRERHEVESMFSNDPDEQVWWEDRR
jgi:hypothetical protein